MLKFAFSSLACVGIVGAALAVNPQPPEMPKPVKEHEFLKLFVGEWESTGEVIPGKGQAPMSWKGVDKSRMLGGFWMITEGKGEVAGMKMDNVFTLGYDPAKKKYVGQWIDSMMPHQWKYEGEVDDSGKKIVLYTEGPCPDKPGVTSKFKETFEYKSDDHKIFTSSIQDDSGKWNLMATLDSKRKK